MLLGCLFEGCMFPAPVHARGIANFSDYGVCSSKAERWFVKPEVAVSGSVIHPIFYPIVDGIINDLTRRCEMIIML